MLSAMKRIGLLGGMSWESSAESYRLINEATRDRLGGLHSADCVLRSVDFADIEEMQSAGSWGDAGERLAAEARSLVAAGAELLVLCTNTMHKVAAAIVAAVEIPFLHIADATADAIAEAGISTVGLLATAYTMEQDFYIGRLRERHGVARECSPSLGSQRWSPSRRRVSSSTRSASAPIRRKVPPRGAWR